MIALAEEVAEGAVVATMAVGFGSLECLVYCSIASLIAAIRVYFILKK